jgi:aryl-alcohol dehydrogenase-like predicted oxidoreductase
MLTKEEFISPIPGSRSKARIKENLGAAQIRLAQQKFAALEAALDKIVIHGNRTDADISKLTQD